MIETNDDKAHLDAVKTRLDATGEPIDDNQFETGKLDAVDFTDVAPDEGMPGDGTPGDGTPGDGTPDASAAIEGDWHEEEVRHAATEETGTPLEADGFEEEDFHEEAVIAPASRRRRWPGLSIRWKLFFAMVLVALLPLVLAVVVSNRVTSDQLLEQTGLAVRESAAQTADLLSQTLVENVHLVETLASSGVILAEVEAANETYPPLSGTLNEDSETGTEEDGTEEDGVAEAPADVLIEIAEDLRQRAEAWRGKPTYDPEVIQLITDDPEVNPLAAELHRFSNRFERHGEILVTDRYGALIGATNRTQAYYFADMDWWHGTFKDGEGGVFLGPPTESPDTGAINVILGVPVMNRAGEAIGALCSALDVREVLGILQQVDLGQTGIVRVYNDRGVAIFDPTAERGLGSEKLPSELAAANILAARAPDWRRARTNESIDAIHGHAQPTRTAAIGAIDQLGWTTVASQNADEALAAVGLLTRLQYGAGFVGLLLAIGAAVVVSLLLTRQIGPITRLFDQIREGNYAARAEVKSRDELGRMTDELNGMLDQTLVLIQSQEERDAIQASVMRLLEEVADVAEGDLTVRAEVTPDITGAIADSFNYMIVELRRIIGEVQNTSDRVQNAAGSIRGRMEELAGGSSSQSQQIVETSERIRTMAASIQQVSETSRQCSEVAGESLDNARQGTAVVERTIAGMNAIRAQVREASKRLKRLGESSQEIGEIVRLIREVSDRTSILALNASIQAAAAGEAGSSFAVVADEIEGLAERSAEASRRIEILIKTVQVETAEAVSAMEDTTREVVEGSESANSAGQALEQIDTVSRRLAELVQTITAAASEQAAGSEAVARAMSQISEITQQAAFGTRQAASAADDLAHQADGLRQSVGRFKVPAAAV